MELNNSMKIILDDILKGKKSVALGGHVRPDGDCVGSCMGLYHYLREQYPDIGTDVYLEEVPEAYSIIKGTDEVKTQTDGSAVYDLFICLDCGDAQRLGFSSPLFENAKETLCIDHHISNDAFADHNYIVPDASSTSELVYNLTDKEKISPASAEALYMGIVHDTGVFQYSCTSPETMEAAAELMRKGINGSEIIDKTYYEKSYIQNQILGRALLESMLIMDKKCIVSVIRQKSMRFFMSMLPVFFARVKPASHIENPACMKNTRAAPISTHIVFTALYSIVVSPSPFILLCSRLHPGGSPAVNGPYLTPKSSSP